MFKIRQLQPQKISIKLCLIVACGLFFLSDIHAQITDTACGSLKNHYGPFDYLTDQGPKIDIVNKYHFNAQVEALIRGQTGSIGGDLSYILGVVPNHHRALLAMERYARRQNSPQPKDAQYSVDCYFQRALRFRPNDNVARLMYANFLATDNRVAEALQHIDQVAAVAGDNAFTHYNAGLLYFDLKEYKKALAQAQLATSLGFERPDLRAKLESAGQWREPTAESTATQTNRVSQ